MRHRTVLLIVATIALSLLAFASTASAMTQTNGGFIGNGYENGMMDSSQQSSTQQEAAVTNVTIQNLTYQPANIQVSVGTTVTWTNLDSVQHTVTFNNGMGDSGLLSPGQSFSYTFNTPGTYQYHCTVHPNMVATVTAV